MVDSEFPLHECTVSWNITGGHNGWSEIYLRGAKGEGEWTLWYPLAFWSPTGSYVGRFSFTGMEDEKGLVKPDYLVFREPVDKLQLKIRRGSMKAGGIPSFWGAYLSWSTERPVSSDNLSPVEYRPIDIEGVPSHSQMVYPDGGNVWCSPTCLSMIVKYYRNSQAAPEACVREAVSGCWDPIEQCHGNWNFNSAWTSSLGYRSYIKRFTRLNQLEDLLSRNIPLPLSISFDNKTERRLDKAPIERTNGHIILLKGFDGKGGAFVFDPAAGSDADVPVTYSCAQLEARWLEASGGSAYIILPEGFSQESPMPSL